MRRPRPFLCLIVWVVAATAIMDAQAGTQTAPSQPLTLDQAIQYASDHYPTVRAALEQVNASAAGVDVARAAYLPRLIRSGSRIGPWRTTALVRCCRRR